MQCVPLKRKIRHLKNVLPKNYTIPDLDKRVLGDVVDVFTNVDMGDTEDSKDLLGRTYEYCIQEFTAHEGVKGGEFYTLSSIVKTIVEILNLLIIVEFMICVVDLVECLYKVLSFYKHIVEIEIEFQYMDKNQMQILGK